MVDNCTYFTYSHQPLLALNLVPLLRLRQLPNIPRVLVYLYIAKNRLHAIHYAVKSQIRKSSSQPSAAVVPVWLLSQTDGP